MLHEIKERFYRFLTSEKGISEKSAIAYLSHLRYLYIHSGREILTLTKYREVADLVISIKEKRNWSDRMTYKVISMACVFYNWAAREEIIKESPMRLGHEFKKCESKQPEFFDWDSEDFKKILYNPQNTIRMRAILFTLKSSGIRNAELCGLEKKDWKDRWLHVRHGKGDRGRYAPIDDECKTWLTIYQKDLQNFYTGPMLFTTERYTPLTPHTLWKSLYQMGNRLGIKIYPHKFRHSLAGKLIERGADLSTCAEILGHKSLSSTKIYVHHPKDKLISLYDDVLKAS